MNMAKMRKLYSFSGARLRRARRLYVRLISERAIGNQTLIVKCTYRAIERGLYSEKTDRASVCMSLLSRLQKIDVQTNKKISENTTATDWLKNYFGITNFYECRDWFK